MFESKNYYFNLKNFIDSKNWQLDFKYFYFNLKFDIWILKFKI